MEFFRVGDTVPDHAGETFLADDGEAEVEIGEDGTIRRIDCTRSL